MWETLYETISTRLGEDRIVAPADAEGRLISVTGEAMKPVPVLRPRDTQELAKALEICSALKTPVIPMGGSTGSWYIAYGDDFQRSRHELVRRLLPRRSVSPGNEPCVELGDGPAEV